MILNCCELSPNEKEVDLNHLNDEEKNELQLLPNKFQHSIYRERDQLTNADSIIQTTTDQSIHGKLHRLLPKHQGEVRKLEQGIEEQGIVRELSSRCVSPTVIVVKKPQDARNFVYV